MRLTDRQFRLVALAAFAALATHLGHIPLWLTLALVGIGGARLAHRPLGGRPVPAWLRVPLVAVLVAAIILQYGNIFGREAGSALAVGLLVLKLVETERVRDARALLGFSAFVLMSALLFNQSLVFTLGLCLLLILVLAALHALEPAALDPERPLRAGLKAGGRLFALGLPLAAAAFLLVPRLGTPLWGAPGLDQIGRTGLDERMSPGSLTELLVDDSPAMRVRFDSPAPPPAARYFRALVLWDFDGTTWSRNRETWRMRAESIEAVSTPIGYEITLEPTDRPWLVALDVPIGAPESTRMSSDHVIVGRLRIATPTQYRATSVVRYRLASELDPLDRVRALQVPDGFNPRSRELAARWRSEGLDDQAVVDAAMRMFNASFSYTLSAPLLGRHSVDEFLFETQAGYCEHYSSAFVFLMRAAGIPARVVTGYQGGWLNELGDYLLVRQSDAHAWSEVWMRGRGWVRVDPTAAVSPARIERGASAVNRAPGWIESEWLLGMRNQFDIVNRLWTQTIVQFNALRQRSVLTPFGIDDADQRDLLVALAGIVAVVLLGMTIWVLSPSRDPRGDSLDALWRRLQRAAARRGVAERTDEGPLDYLERLRAHFDSPPVLRQLDELVHEYIQLRYASTTPRAERVRTLARKVGELRLPKAVKTGLSIDQAATKPVHRAS